MVGPGEPEPPPPLWTEMDIRDFINITGSGSVKFPKAAVSSVRGGVRTWWSSNASFEGSKTFEASRLARNRTAIALTWLHATLDVGGFRMAFYCVS